MIFVADFGLGSSSKRYAGGLTVKLAILVDFLSFSALQTLALISSFFCRILSSLLSDGNKFHFPFLENQLDHSDQLDGGKEGVMDKTLSRDASASKKKME